MIEFCLMMGEGQKWRRGQDHGQCFNCPHAIDMLENLCLSAKNPGGILRSGTFKDTMNNAWTSARTSAVSIAIGRAISL